MLKFVKSFWSTLSDRNTEFDGKIPVFGQAGDVMNKTRASRSKTAENIAAVFEV